MKEPKALLACLLEIMNSEIGEDRHEGKARGGYCFLRRKGHVENQGENLPPIVEICTHTLTVLCMPLKIEFNSGPYKLHTAVARSKMVL